MYLHTIRFFLCKYPFSSSSEYLMIVDGSNECNVRDREEVGFRGIMCAGYCFRSSHDVLVSLWAVAPEYLVPWNTWRTPTGPVSMTLPAPKDPVLPISHELKNSLSPSADQPSASRGL